MAWGAGSGTLAPLRPARGRSIRTGKDREWGPALQIGAGAFRPLHSFPPCLVFASCETAMTAWRGASLVLLRLSRDGAGWNEETKKMHINIVHSSAHTRALRLSPPGPTSPPFDLLAPSACVRSAWPAGFPRRHGHADAHGGQQVALAAALSVSYYE